MNVLYNWGMKKCFSNNKIAKNYITNYHHKIMNLKERKAKLNSRFSKITFKKLLNYRQLLIKILRNKMFQIVHNNLLKIILNMITMQKQRINDNNLYYN